MALVKHSVQRDAILNELCSRKDHPTADELYSALRKTYPKISLGTVYRNLSMLADNGSILRLSYGGADHFDGNSANHYHLYCTGCKRVYDIEMPVFENLESDAENYGYCKITSHILTFFGTCENCLKKLDKIH